MTYGLCSSVQFFRTIMRYFVRKQRGSIADNEAHGGRHRASQLCVCVNHEFPGVRCANILFEQLEEEKIQVSEMERAI